MTAVSKEHDAENLQDQSNQQQKQILPQVRVHSVIIHFIHVHDDQHHEGKKVCEHY